MDVVFAALGLYIIEGSSCFSVRKLGYKFPCWFDSNSL